MRMHPIGMVPLVVIDHHILPMWMIRIEHHQPHPLHDHLLHMNSIHPAARAYVTQHPTAASATTSRWSQLQRVRSANTEFLIESDDEYIAKD